MLARPFTRPLGRIYRGYVMATCYGMGCGFYGFRDEGLRRLVWGLVQFALI